jgi:Ca-activated chloride channel family protein
MPGRDITRLRNRAARGLLLFTFVIWAGLLCVTPVRSQQTSSQSTSQPESKPADGAAVAAFPSAPPSSAPTARPPASSAPPSAAVSQSEAVQSQTQDKPAPAIDKSTQQDKQTEQDKTEKDKPGQKVSDQGVFVFKRDVDEVLLHASVIDDKQHIVTNLDRGAFTVFEDGKPQNIISFRHEDIPVSMGIVIDNSGSMREKRSKVNQAALNLVRASNPKDEVFIVNFNDEYYLDQDFTNDLLRMKEALEKIDARGGTSLYDAVVASADHLKRFARLERKVIFVVTDGEDNASNETLEQAVKQLQIENGPSVYAIGILGDEEHPKRARKALEIMTQRTGGIAFFPKTLDEVDEISRTVAHDIRNQYTIGYKPTNPRGAGGFRAVRIEAKGKGRSKMSVRTKSGYYAGNQPAAAASK